MVDRVDLLIAVIGIVVSVVASNTAIWVTLAKKADKSDLTRLESKLDGLADGLAAKADKADLARLEGKLDALIVRLVPEGRA